jgi:hypothetical protein
MKTAMVGPEAGLSSNSDRGSGRSALALSSEEHYCERNSWNGH